METKWQLRRRQCGGVCPDSSHSSIPGGPAQQPALPLDLDRVRLGEEEWAGPLGKAVWRQESSKREDTLTDPLRPSTQLASALPKAGEGKMPFSSQIQVLSCTWQHGASSVSFLVFLWVFSRCRLSELPFSGQPFSGRSIGCSAPPASCQTAKSGLHGLAASALILVAWSHGWFCLVCHLAAVDYPIRVRHCFWGESSML